MIQRYLFDAILVNSIDATIPRPYSGVESVEHKQNRYRGADQRAIPFVRKILKSAIGDDHSSLAIRQKFCGCRGRDDCIEFLYNNTTSDIASLMAPHAICDRPQAATGCYKVVVFIALSDSSNVRGSAGFDTRNRIAHGRRPSN